MGKDPKLIGTFDVCNDCSERFKCWTGEYGNLRCAAPYSDNILQKWKDDYPALERGVNIELATRKINRELAARKINREQ